MGVANRLADQSENLSCTSSTTTNQLDRLLCRREATATPHQHNIIYILNKVDTMKYAQAMWTCKSYPISCAGEPVVVLWGIQELHNCSCYCANLQQGRRTTPLWENKKLKPQNKLKINERTNWYSGKTVSSLGKQSAESEKKILNV